MNYTTPGRVYKCSRSSVVHHIFEKAGRPTLPGNRIEVIGPDGVNHIANARILETEIDLYLNVERESRIANWLEKGTLYSVASKLNAKQYSQFEGQLNDLPVKFPDLVFRVCSFDLCSGFDTFEEVLSHYIDKALETYDSCWIDFTAAINGRTGRSEKENKDLIFDKILSLVDRGLSVKGGYSVYTTTDNPNNPNKMLFCALYIEQSGPHLDILPIDAVEAATTQLSPRVSYAINAGSNPEFVPLADYTTEKRPIESNYTTTTQDAPSVETRTEVNLRDRTNWPDLSMKQRYVLNGMLKYGPRYRDNEEYLNGIDIANNAGNFSNYKEHITKKFGYPNWLKLQEDLGITEPKPEIPTTALDNIRETLELSSLTEIRQQIALLLKDGVFQEEIARRLNFTGAGVRYHINKIGEQFNLNAKETRTKLATGQIRLV